MRSTRGLSLLGRALLALLRRDARGGWLALSRVSDRSKPDAIARAIAAAYGASVGDRRVLRRVVSELDAAGALVAFEGGIRVGRETDARRGATTRNDSDHIASASPNPARGAVGRETDARRSATARNDSDHDAIAAPSPAQASETLEGNVAATRNGRETDARRGATTLNDSDHDAIAAPNETRDGADRDTDARRGVTVRNESKESDGTALALFREEKKEGRYLVSSSSGEEQRANTEQSELPWQRVPERVAERLSRLSAGRIVLAVVSRDDGLRALLAELDADRPRFAEELDRWAELAAAEKDRWWKHGDRSRERLLGKRDEKGHYAAAGLRRCLEEARGSLYREEARKREAEACSKPPARPEKPGPSVRMPETGKAALRDLRARAEARQRQEAATVAARAEAVRS